MLYKIFDYLLDSSIEFPELVARIDSQPQKTLVFRSFPISSARTSSIIWTHHWRSHDRQIYMSAGKESEDYWLRFPEIADFKLSHSTNIIICYRHQNIPDNTIRHLLIDQVIPRFLSHQGQQIIHASSVKIQSTAIAFAGESGWGKSTIASYLHLHDYTLLADDCLLLSHEEGRICGTPNYCGVRLYQDIIDLAPLFSLPEKNILPVAHYGKKKRLILDNQLDDTPFTLKAVFVLNNPISSSPTQQISINKMNGATAAIALFKNSFPLDITDTARMGYQLQKLAQIGNNRNFSLYSLDYPRETILLPKVMSKILETLSHQPSFIVP